MIPVVHNPGAPHGGLPLLPAVTAGADVLLWPDASLTTAHWLDQSGNGHDFISSGTPVINGGSGALNGYPTTYVGSAAAYTSPVGYSLVRPYTAYIVYSLHDAPVTGFNHRAIQGVTNNWLVGINGDLYRCYGGGFAGGGTGPTLDRYIIYAMSHTGTSIQAFLNGATDGAAGTGSTDPGRVELSLGLSNEPLAGNVAAVILYASAHSNATVIANMGVIDQYLLCY